MTDLNRGRARQYAVCTYALGRVGLELSRVADILTQSRSQRTNKGVVPGARSGS
jgi:hypothetical protein